MACNQPRVLLISMPWASPSHPHLALGLLKATLQRDGVHCDTLYANVHACRQFGDLDLYTFFSLSVDGDLVFTPHYFDVDRDLTAEKLSARVAATGARVMTIEECRALIDRAGEFLRALFASVDWAAYDLVGFSLVFQQLCASLSLAKLIKQQHPDRPIIFGGPTCEGDMGREVLRAFGEVDFVALGESDKIFSAFVREVLNAPEPTLWQPVTPGFAYRRSAGEVADTGAPAPVRDLDSLPLPDYDDYFGLLRADERAAFKPVLYMECSRGCWWGEKSICTFCGLNGSTIAYRSKAPQRCLEEIRYLAERHAVDTFFMADNILDHRAFKTFLGDLARLRAELGRKLRFFFEIKSNVTREQVRQLRDAGIDWVQPGIESFSDHVLQLMHKGVTAIQQVQLLKFLAEFKIRADWNILYANPGERPEDYDEIIETLPFLHHLPPPAPWAVIAVAVQRFNRYFEAPGEFGITALRPAAFYRDTLPRADIRLDRLAYHFEYEHADLTDPVLLERQQKLLAAVDEWRKAYRPGTLTYSSSAAGVRIVDRRGPSVTAGEEIVLTALQAEIYLACESARTVEHLAREFSQRVAPAQLLRFIDMLTARRLMFRSRSGRVLSLALREAAPQSLPAMEHAAGVPREMSAQS